MRRRSRYAKDMPTFNNPTEFISSMNFRGNSRINEGKEVLKENKELIQILIWTENRSLSLKAPLLIDPVEGSRPFSTKIK